MTGRDKSKPCVHLYDRNLKSFCRPFFLKKKFLSLSIVYIVYLIEPTSQRDRSGDHMDYVIIRATTMLVADFGNRSRPHTDMAIVDYDFYNGEAK